MAKITGQIIYELEAGTWSDVDDWGGCNESTQDAYNNFAKDINNFLQYGHLPKKDKE